MRLLQTQESVNPYTKVVVPVNGTAFDVCRGFYVSAAVGATTLTFSDGSSAAFSALTTGIYNFAITKISAGSSSIRILY